MSSGAIQIGVPESRRGAYRGAKRVLGITFAVTAVWFVWLLAARPSAVPWGFLLVSYLFLLGVTQFGVCFAAILRLSRAKWARPYYRIAAVTTLAFFPLAILLFLVIYKFGLQHVLYWAGSPPEGHVSPWLNEKFLFWRNLTVQLVFYAVAWRYFMIGLAPDVDEQTVADSKGWCRWVYRRALRRKSTVGEDRLKSLVYLYSPVVLIACGIANTIISWDFGMMLFPHYHSTVFTLYFLVGNMFAGTALVLLLTVLTGRFVDLKPYFDTLQIKNLGILLTAFALLWVYMFWAQFFVSWFGNLPSEYGILSKSMYGHYAPYFVTMMSCLIVIPISALIFAPLKRMWWSMIVLAMVMCAGIWINRYLIVMPALDAQHHPFSSVPEIALTIGLFAGFLWLLLVLINAFPMVSRWELEDALAEEPAY
ncbi:MAG: NrfD/PsrC family molybdoenzyme membrane anchor subunit [Gammaproteobacteria bacterium]